MGEGGSSNGAVGRGSKVEIRGAGLDTGHWYGLCSVWLLDSGAGGKVER